jgi:hypothetical protein
MPYYANITAKDKEAWRIYKTLKKIANEVFNALRKKHGIKFSLAYLGCDHRQLIVDRAHRRVPRSVTNALQKLINGGGNYGCGITFEFAPRNIGVDKKGKIIFRDILFDADKIEKERARKYKMARMVW